MTSENVRLISVEVDCFMQSADFIQRPRWRNMHETTTFLPHRWL